jgi:hypothetical protein
VATRDCIGGLKRLALSVDQRAHVRGGLAPVLVVGLSLAVGLSGCGRSAITVTYEPRHVHVGQAPFFHFVSDRRVEVTGTVDWCEAPAGRCPRWRRIPYGEVEGLDIGPKQDEAPIETGPDADKNLDDLSGDYVQNTWVVFVAGRPGRYRVTFAEHGRIFTTVIVPVAP